jgi:hypothetical protein
MADSDNRRDTWQFLSWQEKMTICQQSVSQEDSLLSTYVTIYLAIEAMFFAIVLTTSISMCLTIIVGLIAIGVSYLFIQAFLRRGDAVDRWEVIIRELWSQACQSAETTTDLDMCQEMMEHYTGSLGRRARKRWANFWGWNWLGSYSGTLKNKRRKSGWLFSIMQRKGRLGPIKSARWMLITFLPLMICVGWVIVFVIKLI